MQSNADVSSAAPASFNLDAVKAQIDVLSVAIDVCKVPLAHVIGRATLLALRFGFWADRERGHQRSCRSQHCGEQH